MVLQTEVTHGCKSVFRRAGPFAAVLKGEPLRSPCFKLNYLLSVQPVFCVAVIKENPRAVPFSGFIKYFLCCVRKVHCVICAGFLPLCQVSGPAGVINKLVLGTGHVWGAEPVRFNHMIHYSAVAFGCNLPVKLQIKAGILFFTYYITCTVAAGTICSETAIFNTPGAGAFAVIQSPLIQTFAVKQQFPALLNFFSSQLVKVTGTSRQENNAGENCNCN